MVNYLKKIQTTIWIIYAIQQVICEDLKFSFMLPGEATQCFLEEIKEDHVGKKTISIYFTFNFSYILN